MDIEKKISDFKSLSKVANKVELQNIFLIYSEVRRSLDADYEFNKVGAEIASGGTLYEDHKAHFIAKVQFSLKGKPEGTEDDNEIVSIVNEYIVRYSVADRKGLTKKDIKAFCNINAVYNAWPYWREYVQSMTNRMDIPTLIMPLLKFRGPSKKEEGETKTTKKHKKIKA